MNVARRPQEERSKAYEGVPLELLVVTKPVMMTESVVLLETLITEAVITVAMELVAAVTMDAAMHIAPTVGAETTTGSVGECRPAEQQGKHEPEYGTQRDPEHSTEHDDSIQIRCSRYSGWRRGHPPARQDAFQAVTRCDVAPK